MNVHFLHAPACWAHHTLGGCLQAQYDVFSNDLPMPELPPKRTWQAPEAQAAAPSSAPAPSEAVLAGQPPAQRQRLESDVAQARETETQLSKVHPMASGVMVG